MNLPKMPAFVRTNAFVACVCLLGAFVLWHYIHASNNHKDVFSDIPVTYSFGTFTNGMVTASSVQHVTVTISGSAENIAAISPNDIKCSVLLDDQPGKKTYDLEDRNITMPGKKQFTIKVEPKNCTVETDYRRSKSVPVELATQNNLPDGLERESATFTPLSVEITGPASKLDQIRKVSTKPLDLSSVSRSLLNHRIALAAVSNCVLNPDVVSLNLSISTSEIESTLPPLPISVLGPLGRPAHLQVTPQTAVVRVKGTADAVNRLMQDELVVFVDARDIPAGTSRERPIRAMPPAGVRVLSFDPVFATVTSQGPDEP